jgi:hypothetical protein
MTNAPVVINVLVKTREAELNWPLPKYLAISKVNTALMFI